MFISSKKSFLYLVTNLRNSNDKWSLAIPKRFKSRSNLFPHPSPASIRRKKSWPHRILQRKTPLLWLNFAGNTIYQWERCRKPPGYGVKLLLAYIDKVKAMRQAAEAKKSSAVWTHFPWCRPRTLFVQNKVCRHQGSLSFKRPLPVQDDYLSALSPCILIMIRRMGRSEASAHKVYKNNH